jgi:DNA-binding beta-propeller fold protein YncE
VVAPTGLGLGRHGQLYVADTGKNRITLITHAITRTSSAGTGTVITSGRFLKAPLGLAVAGDGDVLTVNAGNGRIVETAPDGRQVSSEFLDTSGSPPGDGALFGLAIAPHGAGIYYVDDAANTLRLLR